MNNELKFGWAHCRGQQRWIPGGRSQPLADLVVVYPSEDEVCFGVLRVTCLPHGFPGAFTYCLNT